MKKNYEDQSFLVLKILPLLNLLKKDNKPVFSLKGGTAINFFLQDFPRLSVDIDLSYNFLENRDLTSELPSTSIGRG